jgi:hypothetical protein
MATRRANAGEPVFRLRPCVLCHALFVICRSCDRGQRYCNGGCRFSAWREQRRQANRRHQRSPGGRADHRDRQRAYRKRCAQRRWAALGSAAAGKSAVTECVSNAQLRVVGPSILSSAFPSPALPRSLPPSHNETLTPKNVTDKASATLTSPDMMAARDSGSASAMSLSSSVAKTGHRRWLPGQKPDRELVSDGLRCMICGRCGYFVDPFPPFHFPQRRLAFDDQCES